MFGRASRCLIVCLAASLLAGVGKAAAQPERAILYFVVSATDGGPTLAATAELVALDDAAAGARAPTRVVPRPASPPARVDLSPGTYIVRVSLAGYQDGEATVLAAAGSTRVLTVVLAPVGGTERTMFRVEGAHDIAHQIAWSAAELDALPHGGSVWSLLDAVAPFIIGDRIDGGAFQGAVPLRLGGYGSSWSQTALRYDGVDITDPTSGGVPLVFPGLQDLGAVVVASAARGVESPGVGPAISLVPFPASRRWRGTIGGAFAPSGAAPAVVDGRAPAIAEADSWSQGDTTLGGRLADRMDAFVAARVLRTAWLERGALPLQSSRVGTLSARLTAASRRGDGTAVVLANEGARPSRARVRFQSRDVQERFGALITRVDWRARAGWTLAAGFERWGVRPDPATSVPGGTVERLLDGPPRALLDFGQVDARRVTIESSATRPTWWWRRTRHEMAAGVALSRTVADRAAGADPSFLETVDGHAARAWAVGRPSASVRGMTTAGAYVSDQVSLGAGVTARGGVRLDVDRGSARGSTGEIAWATVSPRASLRWLPLAERPLTLTAAYGRYGHRLPLDMLAVGDPGGAAGVVSRWDDANGDRQAAPSELTAVTAIGRAPDGSLNTRIDPGTRRPTTREFLIGFEHGPGAWRWGVSGVDRRESNLLVLQETGVTAADYDVRLLTDPGIDLLSDPGPPSLPVSSRRATSFLHDTAVLRNTSAPAARFQAAEIFAHLDKARWRLRFGGMTYRAEAAGASRGFRSDENDQGLLGEVGLDPQAGVFARGRLFFDRAYVIKVSGDVRAPAGIQFGAAARYQDGQPFSRVVVATDLGQGPDIVPAYPRGGQRFTYVLTVDARLRKAFHVAGRRVDAIVDVFNLLNGSLEVEERIVTGPGFRTITAVQPPRFVTVGVRVSL